MDNREKQYDNEFKLIEKRINSICNYSAYLINEPAVIEISKAWTLDVISLKKEIVAEKKAKEHFMKQMQTALIELDSINTDIGIVIQFKLENKFDKTISEIVFNIDELYNGSAKEKLERIYDTSWLIINKRAWSGKVDKNGKMIF